jgi:hypothetical protein
VSEKTRKRESITRMGNEIAVAFEEESNFDFVYFVQNTIINFNSHVETRKIIPLHSQIVLFYFLHAYSIPLLF